MKIRAIAGGRSKRDFIDVLVLSRDHDFEQLLDWFRQKYARTPCSMVHVLKALTCFADAEKHPMPHLLVNLDSETVKQYFPEEVPRRL